MSPDQKKSFESLEEAFLQALDLDKKAGEKQDEPSAPGLSKTPQPAEVSSQPLQGWPGKELRIASDHMSATLVVTGGGPVSVAEITSVLNEAGITHGISQEALKKLEELCRIPGGTGEFLIASGARPGVRRRVIFSFLQDKKITDAATLDFVGLKNMLTASDMAEVQTGSVMVKAVNAGELFLQVKVFPEAQAGRDIFGREIDGLADPLPEAGDNVRINDKSGGYEAAAYGYLLLDKETVAVFPPIWTAADRTAAYYLSLPQLAPCRYPTKSEMKEMLLRLGVHEQCIHDAAISKLAGQMAAGLPLPRLVKLAETLQPRPGTNAEFSLFVDTEKKAGTLRSDGSLDLRERNAVVSIPEGMLIAEKTLATKGVDGCSLFGKIIKATAGLDKKINIGKGIRAQQTENIIRYFAEKKGNIRFSRGALSVEDIFEIPEDVNYHTGNIDVKTDLLIKGSVLSGFTVRSEGDIAILGAVENGATVIAGGNLTVDKGIVGENSKIIARGNLRAGYIQRAEVIVKGDVVVNSYLYNCKLIATGSVTVLSAQGQKGGRAVGGIICSSKRVRLSILGSPDNTETIVAVRPDPEITVQLKKLEEQGVTCTQNITKISRSLPFDSFEPARIKAALAHVPAEKKEAVVLLLSNLNKLIKHKKILGEAIGQLRDRITIALSNARIEVSQQIFQGSEIHIGDQKYIITRDMGTSVFSLQDGKIERI
ncbi:MAG: DUF342 domain-containing protein [Deltaproteobacteria bacterium]|nr:DUF342 domain-containing protein [Deltaproteobacteria bacterium]